MKTSADGLAFIRKWEGCVLHPYIDQVGVSTIGIGHRIKPGERFTTISEPDAEALLAIDVVPCEAKIAQYVAHPLGQHQFDALVSWLSTAGLMRSSDRASWSRSTKGSSTTFPHCSSSGAMASSPGSPS